MPNIPNTARIECTPWYDGENKLRGFRLSAGPAGICDIDYYTDKGLAREISAALTKVRDVGKSLGKQEVLDVLGL